MSVPSSPNDRPLDDFEGLTPRQVHHLFHDFLGAGSLVKVGEAPGHPPGTDLPLLWFASDLLDRLAGKEIQLTAKGNLPGKLVKELYATGQLPDDAIELGLTKLTGEDDYLPLQAVKYVLLQLGWTKKRNNRLSLTAKGKKARWLPPTEFFRAFFLSHLRKFNLGWMDRFSQSGSLQHVAPYLLYLLLLRGGTSRPVVEYTRRLAKAFPYLDQNFPGTQLERAAQVRIFERFLAYYGLVEVTREQYNPPRPAEVATTDRFRSVFHLDPDARPAPPSEEEQYQRQLKVALFDAEMGSQSYFSDDMPLEMVEAFQRQIRELDALQSRGDTVRIGDLLGDMPLVPPGEITDADTARRETARIADALGGHRIILADDDTAEMGAISFYAYVYDLLLNHRIVPPPPRTTRVVPLHEVLTAQQDPVEALTEAFLLALFDLDTPFPPELLAHQMRLNNRVVPRTRGLHHLQQWRARHHRVTPLSFETLIDGPEVAPSSERQAVQLFVVAYEVTPAPGASPETFEGPGVVECILEDGGWRVTGARFPGFVF